MQTIRNESKMLSWRPLRWLLQLDIPVAERTDAEVEAEVWRNYRWNFNVNLLDGGFFWLGLSFASASTILPLFVSKLSDNPLLIGLVAVLAQAGWYLPQLLRAGAIERTARKKPWVVNLGLFTERLPVALWIVAALLATVSPTAALVLFFITYAMHQLGAGLIAPAWQDLIAVCFPVTRRGRFMGLAFFLGTGAGAIGALGSSQILEYFPFPYDFAILFGLATFFIMVSWIFIALTREPVRPVHESSYVNPAILGKLNRILRQDDNFRRFLLARILISLGAMGFGFVAVSAVARFDVPDRTVGLYTAALMIGQTGGNLLMGLLADRYGHKLSMELSCITLVAAFVLAWLAPSPIWYYSVFAMLGIYSAGMVISGLLIVMEFTDRSSRPTYAGIANTGVGVANTVAPLIGGWLALYGYHWLFIASIVLGLLGLILLHVWVEDPRHRSARPSLQLPLSDST
jgi:MFS family permease